MVRKRFRLNTFQVIILSFAALILLGAILLLLPISSNSRTVTPFNQALFTSVSAVCVTGLVVVDTATHWSGFGQAVILILIQIGGLGVITAISALSLLFGRKISLTQKTTMKEAISALKMGGIVRLTIFILVTSLVIEFIGALIMLPVFVLDFGAKGIWMAAFHSVSAFCNAGFDIMGTADAQFASLTGYSSHPIVNLTVMSLIFVGGIGFLTLDDIRANKGRFKYYCLQSKVILITSAVFIVLPALYFFFAEFSRLPFWQRLFGSLFQAITPRTAGFNTLDLSSMSGASRAVIIVLMLVGGSPGSTAGGMKTTTFAVLFACALSVFRKKEDTQLLGRRVSNDTVKSAFSIFLLYLTLFISVAIAISIAEGLPLDVCMFETASAVGTVGLTLGITPSLGIFSQILLMSLMFIGRVGGLTLVYATLAGPKINPAKLPQEQITVG